MSTTIGAAASSAWALAPAPKPRARARTQAVRRTDWRRGMSVSGWPPRSPRYAAGGNPGLGQLGFLQCFVRLDDTLQARLGAAVSAVGVGVAALDQLGVAG